VGLLLGLLLVHQVVPLQQEHGLQVLLLPQVFPAIKAKTKTVNNTKLSCSLPKE
jgi:hypothetical protein